MQPLEFDSCIGFEEAAVWKLREWIGPGQASVLEFKLLPIGDVHVRHNGTDTLATVCPRPPSEWRYPCKKPTKLRRRVAWVFDLEDLLLPLEDSAQAGTKTFRILRGVTLRTAADV